VLGADAAAAQRVGGRRAAEPRADGVVRSQQVRAGRAGRDIRRAHTGRIGCEPVVKTSFANGRIVPSDRLTDGYTMTKPLVPPRKF